MFEHLTIGWIDLVVIAVYLAGITYLGVRAARRIHNTGDFYMGGRRFGKAMMIMHAFGTGTHSDQAVTVVSKSCSGGLSGIWYQWLWLFCTPFYWLIAPIFRRMRCLTIADAFEKRYGQGIAALYAFVGIFMLSTNIGIMLFLSGKTIHAITGIPEWLLIAVMSVLFVSYSTAGGLVAAVLTDFVQGLFIIVLSFLLVPFALYHQGVGGFAGLHEKLKPAMFSLTAPEGITLFWIVMAAINGLVGIVAQPHIMGNTSAGKTEWEGRVGFAYGTFLKRICTIAWAFLGVCCAVIFMKDAEVMSDPDLAFGRAALILLPTGLVGVLIASIIASVMSSCDSFMISTSALFTQNVYKVWFAPDRDERHYIKVARIVGIVVVIAGIIASQTFPNAPAAIRFFWKVTALMGVPMWTGIVWWRSNRQGAFAGFLGALAGWLMMHFHLTPLLAERWGRSPESLMPYEMLIYLVMGFTANIVVSLLTKPEDEKRLNEFYTLIHTPIGQEEKLEEAGIEVVSK